LITLKRLILSSLVSLSFLVSALWIPATTPSRMTGTGPCGVERWAVKTLSDPAAKKVNFKPEDTTIQWLVKQQSPLKGNVMPRNRLSPLEYKTFRVKAIVIAYKLESDRDFHIVVADPDNRRQTMVVEIPDPECDGAKSSDFANKYQSARSVFINLLGPPQRSLRRPGWDVYVTITGVAFFDAIRGQTGGSANGIELHPVLSFEK
jgi:hypothetical protein